MAVETDAGSSAQLELAIGEGSGGDGRARLEPAPSAAPPSPEKVFLDIFVHFHNEPQLFGFFIQLAKHTN